MPTPLRITSPDNPRIKAVVRLREQRERRKTGLFTVERSREIERALDAGLSLIELYHLPTEQVPTVAPLLKQAESRGVRPVEVTAPILARMCYQQNPEGLIAVFEAPPPRKLENIDISAKKPPLILVAVGLAKPGNLGAIARTLSAAGGDALVIADQVVDPFNPNAIRASTGAVFSSPCIAGSLDEIVKWCDRHSVRLVATSPDAPNLYTETDLTGPIALVVGPEDTGLPPEWFEAIEMHHGLSVRIPMAPTATDSLNAATAAAVVLFEAVRQRSRK
ncbi:MAG: RNA methyltransferase [Phycisphaera sp.]|nr:RNA methyltransferase [Phycisphaera sp.]